MATPADGPSRIERLPWFALAACALVLVRFAHLGETIDGPHSGRQCDTAFYALDFHRTGLHLFRPSVCWLGAHKALALEFPFPEAMTAVLYRVLGPRILWARLVALAFFLGSAWYLYRIVSYVRSGWTAKLVVLLYLAMPLAQNYSRAVHVDFAALFFAYGMLYYLLRGYDEERTGLIALAAGLGTLAFLIKGPYAFYLFLPFGLHVLRQPRLRRLARWVPLLVLPLVAFALWRLHAARVNAAAPDWSLIPRYFKFTDMSWWYYGPLAQRLDVGNWLGLGYRTLHLLPGALGVYFLVLGMLARPADRRGIGFFWLWLLGTGVYLLIFFNLNLVHDYYQIPFLAPVAFFMAMGLEWLFLDRPRLAGLRSVLPFAFTMVVLLAKFVHTAETSYYEVDRLSVAAGEAIRANTPNDALVIGSVDRTQVWWWDARLLYRADRCGWSVPLCDLGERVWEGLVPAGATHLAIISDKAVPAALGDALRGLPSKTIELSVRPWRAHIYDLRAARAPAP